MLKRSVPILILLCLVIALGACAPAASPSAAPAITAPTQVSSAQPTTAPTSATTTAATTAATAAPTATPPPPNCTKMANAPAAPAAGQLGAADKPIVMTFVPSGDVPTITRAGTGIADCLSKLTGLTYKIEVGTANSASIEAMGAGKAQIGFLNTFSVLLARVKYGVEPQLVASRSYVTNDLDPDKGLKGTLQPFYKGQFITKTSSGIKSIADLKGKTFCFTDPTSTSGTIIPQIVLKANGINPDKDLKATQFAGSHPNVAAAVYKGDCDAGATFIDVRTDAAVQKAYPDIMDKTTVFFDTIRIPNDGVQTVKDFDAKLKDATVNGLLAMMQDPGGKAMVRSLYGYDAFGKVDPTFYDEFKDLMVKAGVDPASFVK